jgi:homoserine O-acetyltransferase
MKERKETASAGVVRTQAVKITLPAEGFRLECGEFLPELTVAYETHGALRPDRTNAVFICHALTGDSHVAGRHDTPDGPVGWWDEMVGPGKGINTRLYYVVCANILGGCKGTTGPASTDPRTGKPYGSAFPKISVADVVNAHRLFLQEIGIVRLAALVGGSFGGMQVLDWVIRYPDTVDRCVCIASAARLSTQALAFDIVGRSAILSDPNWLGGDFYGTDRLPSDGLSLARKIGHITYLSTRMMTEKFGRERSERPRGGADEAGHPSARFRSTFEVESYLDHQGAKFVGRFDANSYLHITAAMDECDFEERYGSLEKAFATVRSKMLIVALSSDWLFPPAQSVELANALLRAGRDVSYCLLHAPHGHDAFLVDIEYLAEVLRAFFPWVRGEGEKPHAAQVDGGYDEAAEDRSEEHREEFQIVSTMVRPGARVLDLGCGRGDLLSLLREKRSVSGIGVDIDIQHVIDVIDAGHNMFQGDIDAGLAMIPDGTYDYAILSETLQVVHKPRLVLREMLRVAREGIVTFPNFGKLLHRVQLGLRGRMPVGRTLPFEWYDTPNIHLFTLQDFAEVCRKDAVCINEIVCIPAGLIGRLLVALGFCNLGADRVIAKIERCKGPEKQAANRRTYCRVCRAQRKG